LRRNKVKKINRISHKEREYVLQVLDGAFNYKMVSHLEKEFAEKFGAKYGIAMNNGTATLHVALESCGVRIGDEVICPPLTMSSTSIAVLHANAIPVFADVDPDTFLITAESIRKVITKKTKAIITVSLFGLSPDMDAIMDLDAQCFLAKYKGRNVGTLGHMASFSFQSSKHMTAGEGGMVITDDPALALNLRRYSGLGYGSIGLEKGRITKDDIQNPDYERHVVLGWNYRASDLCGAVALAQLEHLDELVEMRVIAAKHLLEAAKGCDWLKPQHVPSECEHSYWTCVFVLDTERIGWTDFRKKFMELGGDGIYSAWKLSYLEPMFREKNFLGREQILEANNHYLYEPGLCPVAEYIQPRLLQFKTNYWDEADSVRQERILKETIEYFS
jgi:perosamine synthetase